jgi:hypothetical protein
MKPKTTLHLIMVVAVMVFCGSMLPHKFYVSLTEIRFNGESSRLEVSMRIFPDDMDQVLLERSGTETFLATKMEPPGADSILQAYLVLHFTLESDGIPVSLRYLGKEPEADALWCYFESEPIAPPLSLTVHNGILMDKFEDQVNIVQVYWGEWNKGLLCTSHSPGGELFIGD